MSELYRKYSYPSHGEITDLKCILNNIPKNIMELAKVIGFKGFGAVANFIPPDELHQKLNRSSRSGLQIVFEK